MLRHFNIALLVGILMLSGCGYHLVGHGGGSGAIPDDVTTVTVTGNIDGEQLARLRRQLQSERYRLVGNAVVADQTHHAIVSVHMNAPIFSPSAYDISGVATQYRMTITGALQVDQNGQTIWQSGPIQRQGDVFVTGGPVSIEASKQRLQQDLRKQWLNDAIGRLRSGF